MFMLALWLCWVVPREVSQPLVSKRFAEVSSPSPELTYRFGLDGSGKFTTEALEAEPSGSFKEVSCHLGWWQFSKA